MTPRGKYDRKKKEPAAAPEEQKEYHEIKRAPIVQWITCQMSDGKTYQIPAEKVAMKICATHEERTVDFDDIIRKPDLLMEYATKKMIWTEVSSFAFLIPQASIVDYMKDWAEKPKGVMFEPEHVEERPKEPPMKIITAREEDEMLGFGSAADGEVVVTDE